MRTSLATIRTAVAVGSVAYAFTAASAMGKGVIVFDNTASQAPLYLPSPRVEYGDEYRLSVPGLTLDCFAIQYWNGNTAAPGKITVWVRANDGGVDANNAANPSPAPGTALYVDTEALVAGVNTFGRADLAQFGITLGDRVTITALFDVQNHGQVGLLLSNNPESVGWSPDDYWQHTGAGTAGGPFGTFGGPFDGRRALDVTAKIEAVPEPSTWLSLGGLLAMVGFGAYRRFRK